jgi:DNA-binding winged helix-turn-helix (wHTH) protein
MNYNEFHILSYLIENNNKIISKDVLLSVGWPDNVVTDASLHRSIFSLRAVLSPSNIEIKTISGRGYLLIIDSKCIENKNK